MFADDDKPHPDWEMNRTVQRRLSIGILLVIGAVVFLNLAASPDHDFWQFRQDRAVEFQSASR
jgi:hypothetical protein